MTDEDPLISATKQSLEKIGDDIHPDVLIKLAPGPQAVRADRAYWMRVLDADGLQTEARAVGHEPFDEELVARALAAAHNVAAEDLASPMVLLGVAASGETAPQTFEIHRKGFGRFRIHTGPGDQHVAAIRDLAASIGQPIPSGVLPMITLVTYDGMKPDVRIRGGDFRGSKPNLSGTGWLVPTWSVGEAPDLRVVDDRVYPPASVVSRPYYCAVVVRDEADVFLVASWDLDANVPGEMTPPEQTAALERVGGSPVLAAADALLGAIVSEFGNPGGERGRQVWSGMTALIQALVLDEKTPLTGSLGLKFAAEQIPGDAAVIYGDLNRFKRLNDDHGHRAGDAALSHFGRLVKAIADPFAAMSFRESGDEFVIISPMRHVAALLEDLSRVLRSAPFEYEGSVHSLSMSFGWCELPHGQSYEPARRNAELACEVAKNAGDGTVVKWSPEVEVLANERVTRRFRCECGAAFQVSLPQVHRALSCPCCGMAKS
ncbi:MAG: GGDEF domain-containing protein [Myxococcales bacterium]|nr:GGDEF domain-containing protein [Myxococcales bacterium]